jgi:hypothetical protein
MTQQGAADAKPLRKVRPCDFALPRQAPHDLEPNRIGQSREDRDIVARRRCHGPSYRELVAPRKAVETSPGRCQAHV